MVEMKSARLKDGGFNLLYGNKIGSAQDCKERLARYLPGYDKSIDASKFTAEKISAAIHRAKQRDNPPCEKWPHSIGGTTVYKLIENIYKTP